MTCDELRAYIDATLPEERMAYNPEVQHHINQCPACAAYAGRLADLEQQLSLLPPIPAEPFTVEAVMQRIRGESPAPAPSPVPATLPARPHSEGLMWLALPASLALTALAYLGTSSGAESLRGDFSIHWVHNSLLYNLLHQGPSTSLLCGLAAVLAAVALLWHDSEDSEQGYDDARLQVENP